MSFNPLTPLEERVILHKGTEAPFTGDYHDYWEEGTYVCKRCDAPLYQSSTKFDAHCGWPSFDDEIPGSVKRVVDADGRRTEILCARCGGHLGHVFTGEGFTPKNTRHCVNSVSMKFVNQTLTQEKMTERAVFASGCFWGVQYHFDKAKGVLKTTVGYTGGTVKNPSYKEVCTGRTGHAEAVEVLFDPSITSFETLCRLFFETHDFTQVGGQGPDIGDQYRSEIFYENQAQKEIAEKLIEILSGKGYKVATALSPVAPFYTGEDYHQYYYDKTRKQPYCHIYKKIF